MREGSHRKTTNYPMILLDVESKGFDLTEVANRLVVARRRRVKFRNVKRKES